MPSAVSASLQPAVLEFAADGTPVSSAYGDVYHAAQGGPVAEGSVGGGNGMICYEYKGGTGTSSRIVRLAGQSYTVAALVQANHGIRPWLTIAGKHLWPEFDDHLLLSREQGTIIVIIATDAPLTGLQLRHFAKRAAQLLKNG